MTRAAHDSPPREGSRGGGTRRIPRSRVFRLFRYEPRLWRSPPGGSKIRARPYAERFRPSRTPWRPTRTSSGYMPFSVVVRLPMARAYESAVQSLGVLASRSTPYSTRVDELTPLPIPRTTWGPPAAHEVGSVLNGKALAAPSGRGTGHQRCVPRAPGRAPEHEVTSAPSSIFL